MKPLIIQCLLLIFLTAGNTLQAQRLMNFHKKALNKLESKLADRMLDKGADAAADASADAIDKGVTNIMRQAYRNKYGEELTDAEVDSLMYADGQTSNAFIEGMNAGYRVPNSYDFHFKIVTQYSQEDEEPIKTEMWFAKDEAIIMVKQEGVDEQFTIMDLDNDLMVSYNSEEKTAYAIANVMSMAMMLSNRNKSEKELESNDFVIEGPLSSKNILGYNSNLYRAENDEYKFDYYLTKEIPFQWQPSFVKFQRNFSPAVYTEMNNEYPGMMLEGETTDKTKNKVTKIKTISLDEVSQSIKKSDYNFGEQ